MHRPEGVLGGVSAYLGALDQHEWEFQVPFQASLEDDEGIRIHVASYRMDGCICLVGVRGVEGDTCGKGALAYLGTEDDLLVKSLGVVVACDANTTRIVVEVSLAWHELRLLRCCSCLDRQDWVLLRELRHLVDS